MTQTIKAILAGLLAVGAVGAAIVGYVAWRTQRRDEDARTEAGE